MTRIFAIFILLAAPLLLAGCPNPYKKDGKHKGAQLRMVKGNPMVFVNGTQMNRKNSLPLDLLADDLSYALGVGGWVEEKAEAPKKKSTDGEEPPTRQGKEAAEEMEKNMVVTKFTRSGDIVIADDGTYKVQYQINRETNTFKLAKLSYKDNGQEITYSEGQFEVLHSSMKNDRRAFTFLIAGTEALPKGRYVISVGLYPPYPIKESAFTLDKFNYIYGVGVKILWPQDQKREVVLCHSPSPEISKAFGESLKDWTNLLKNRLDFTAKYASACPPFSDLNTQTTTVLDDWIEIQGEQGLGGITTWRIDAEKAEILDADIFIFREELAENWAIYVPGKDVKSPTAAKDRDVYAFYFETFQHEFGHLLGLHHQFDETIKSIMGYDPNVTTLQTYDINAIQALYPLKNPSPN